MLDFATKLIVLRCILGERVQYFPYEVDPYTVDNNIEKLSGFNRATVMERQISNDFKLIC